MSFDPTEEGDRLEAASVNDRLTEVANALNDLPARHVARGRLGEHHLPDLLNATTLLNNFTAGSDETLLLDERYDNTIPVAGGGIGNYLELFAPSGPYGPYTRPAAGIAEEGWLIPRTSGTAPTGDGMSVVFNRSSNLVFDGLVGLLATAWVAVEDVLEVADDPLLDPNADPNATVDLFFNSVYLAIGIRDMSGTRRIIERSIRRVTSSTVRRGPMSTLTYITAADLTAGSLDGTVEEVFGAVISGVAASDAAQHAPLDLVLRRFQISVEPIRAGVLD